MKLMNVGILAIIVTCIITGSISEFEGSRIVHINLADKSDSYIAVDGKCVNGTLSINVQNMLWNNKYIYVHIYSECKNVSVDSRVVAIAPCDSATISGYAKNVTEVPLVVKAWWDGGKAIVKFSVRCT
ncbi:MAG: hypothetical protein DSY33_01580 [Archaeoglobus sp.]|nr:MAG: hypothetical protein DSY33_01580 [Archaeoglobus sp.]